MFGLFALAAAATAAAAQDPPAGSPKPVPGPFRAFIVSDQRSDPKDPQNRTGMMHDLVTENGLNPTVAVFARTTPQAADAPLAKLVRQLDGLAQKYRADRLGAFVIFLTLGKEYPEDEQRDEKAKAVRDLAEQLKAQNVPFALAAGGGEPAKAWGLQEGHDVTVVLYNRLRVVQAWTFAADKPPSDEDLKKIADAIEAAMRPKKK
jgi:hypothetical protein